LWQGILISFVRVVKLRLSNQGNQALGMLREKTEVIRLSAGVNWKATLE